MLRQSALSSWRHHVVSVLLQGCEYADVPTAHHEGDGLREGNVREGNPAGSRSPQDLEHKQLRLGVFQAKEDREGSSSGLLAGVSSTTVFLTASELRDLRLTPASKDLQ